LFVRRARSKTILLLVRRSHSAGVSHGSSRSSVVYRLLG
jgi:hypothetical protein